MKSLEQLKDDLLADGIIDSSEVSELRTILFEDGVIDTEEANFLFEINDAVSGKANDPEWSVLFIDAITSYLLDDENSPGEIDEEEAIWLYERISGDGQLDETERRLLHVLKSKAKTFPKILQALLN